MHLEHDYDCIHTHDHPHTHEQEHFQNLRCQRSERKFFSVNTERFSPT